MFSKSIRRGDVRTSEQIQRAYSIEKELANQLRSTNANERQNLYSTLYDKLFQEVPEHPLLTQKKSPELAQKTARRRLNLLIPLLAKVETFLEIGPGDCELSFQMASLVRQVYAVDVSAEITGRSVTPKNFQLFISNGTSIPVPEGSVDLAYSNQLMEHLHPEDAKEQLVNIYKALAKGGSYVCLTPNRLLGPHDISRYFDDVATGFHLKEYTINELTQLFRETGFSEVMVYAGGRGLYVMVPLSLALVLESWIAHLSPKRIKTFLRTFLPARFLLGITLVGVK